MISLTRLNDQPIMLNCDLIETIEANPDTMITLTTGQKIVVLEKTVEVVNRIHSYRESVVRRAGTYE